MENQGYPHTKIGRFRRILYNSSLQHHINIILTILVMFSMKHDQADIRRQQSMIDGDEFNMATSKLEVVISHATKYIGTRFWCLTVGFRGR